MPAISSFATGDLLPIVDVSEISASDKNKSVTFGELFRNVLGGSASAPSIAFTGDQNTGIYSPGADQVAVATNGTGRLFVDASGNVGVGTSSVNALLEVNNSTAGGEVQRIEGNYSGSGSVILTNWRRAGGSVAAALKYNDDSSPLCMSIGTTTSHEFRIRTADTDAITIDTSQRVGIGTSSPNYKLEVAPDANRSFAVDTDGSFSLVLRNTATNAGADLAFDTKDSLQFKSNGDTKVTILNTGRVGIGTTSPGELLSLSQDVTTEANLLSLTGTSLGDGEKIFATFKRGTVNLARVGAEVGAGGTAGQLIFETAISNTSTERARIDSSGRLLVGTSSARTLGVSGITPQVLLEGTSGSLSTLSAVRNSNSSAGPNLVLGKSRSATVGGSTVVQDGDELGNLEFYGADGTQLIYGARIAAQVDGTPGANDMPGRLVFSTTADGASSPTERMRINASGQTLIGKTSDTLSTPGWAIDGGSFIGRGQLTCGSSGAPILRLNHTGGAGTEYVVESWKNGTQVGSISVTASATSYNTSSDYRLKENVTLLTGATDRLKQIPVHRFNFIADPDTVVDGFLAHEAQAVVPECITGTKDEVDDDGNPVYQGIDQSKLVPLLTAALQEAIGRIETLEGMVAVNNITIDEQQHQLSTLAARLTALESA
jgi:hypothetical protein